MDICYIALLFKIISKQNITHKLANWQKGYCITHTGKGRKEEQVDEKKHKRKVQGKSWGMCPSNTGDRSPTPQSPVFLGYAKILAEYISGSLATKAKPKRKQLE